MTTRRIFLQKAGVGLLAMGASSVLPNEDMYAAMIPAEQETQKKDLFHVAVAGYTFVHFNTDQMLDMMKRTSVKYLCIKNFHLPYDATKEECDAFHAKLKTYGVTGYGIGPVNNMTTEQMVDDAFAYAKRAGVNLIVGVPHDELLPYIDKKVKEYDFRFAIHNHGPGDPIYPNAQSIWDKVKDFDPRIGMCLDIGHNVRTGADLVADLKKYHKRVFDIHIKDVTAAAREGTDIEMGRGIIDIPAFVNMLRKVKYTGACSLEYEKDMKDPLAGIAESIGYFKGVMAGTF